MKILRTIEKLIIMVKELVVEHPTDARIKVMLLSLEEIKRELSKSDLDKTKISHLAYGITRVFSDMLDFEKTPFGEELGEFLLDLNEFV